MFNNFNNGYNGFMGYAGNQMQQAPEKIQMRQLLSADEQDQLRKKNPEFSGRLTKEEGLKALCTHKDARTGAICLEQQEDGSVTCSICGENFHLIETGDGISMEEIENTCSNFNDIFQSIKLMYGAIPEDVGRNLYLISGFIKKVPSFYAYAKKYFERIGGVNTGVQNYGAGNQAMMAWQNLYGPFGGNMGMGGMMNPSMVLQQQQAMQAQQQQMAPQTAMGMMNPMQQQAMQAQQQQMAPQGAMNPAMGMGMMMGQAPAINYGAPVAGNGVGYVVPEQGPATTAAQGKTEQKATTVKSPDINNGFKG